MEILLPFLSLFQICKSRLSGSYALSLIRQTFLWDFNDWNARGDAIITTKLRVMMRDQQKKQAGRSARQDQLSASEAAWLFICNPRKLKLRQVRQLDPLRRLEEELEHVYQLTQDFRVMITRRCSYMLGPWLAEVKRSGIPELRSLATGIYRDYEAVWAALTTPYSNGQTEAQVHRLKLIKRPGYGRAKFDLLRLRVLHGSAMPNQRKCV